MTLDKLKQQLNERVQVPSLNNAWLMPIKTRIDMQSTGINTPIGIKIAGPDLAVIEDAGLLADAGLPPHVLTVLGTDVDDARAAIDVGVDKVVLTVSHATGRDVLAFALGQVE